MRSLGICQDTTGRGFGSGQCPRCSGITSRICESCRMLHCFVLTPLRTNSNTYSVSLTRLLLTPFLTALSLEEVTGGGFLLVAKMLDVYIIANFFHFFSIF